MSSLNSLGPGCRPAGSSSFPPIAAEMAAALSALQGPLGLRSPPGSAFFGTAHARSVLERINFLPLLIAGLLPAPSLLCSLAASAKLARTEVRDGSRTGGLRSGRRSHQQGPRRSCPLPPPPRPASERGLLFVIDLLMLAVVQCVLGLIG